MADQQNPANPQSQGAGSEGDTKKLIFDKYKTIEEAEVGYKNAERLAHEASQRASQWEEIAKQREQVAAQEGEYGRGGTYVPAPQHNPDQAAAVLTRFYQNPVEVFREVSEVASQEAEKRILKRQNEESNNRARITAWIAKNKDLEQHGDLIDFYVRQTDGRLAVESRLDAAAASVRKRLVELRGEPGEANPDPGSYVPGPSGSRDGAPPARPAAPPATDGESQLASYAASRNTNRLKIPGRHGR